MADRNTNVALLLAGVETTEGTDPTLVIASNAIQVMEPLEPNIAYAFQAKREKVIAGAAIQHSPPLMPAGRHVQWQNTVHVRGSRGTTAFSASVLPELDPFYQSAGFSQTLVTTGGAESVTYKPAATNLKSHAEYYYVDGRKYVALGCKTDLSFAFDSGGPLIATLKRMGLMPALPTDAAVPAVSGSPWGTAVAPVAVGVALSITPSGGGAFTAGIIRKFSSDMGNDIKQRPNANAAAGLTYHKVRERKPKFTIVLEDELGATADFQNWRSSRTPLALSFAIGGATQYNRFGWSAPQAIVEDVKIADDNGTQIVTLTGGLFDSTFGANDAVQHQFT